MPKSGMSGIADVKNPVRESLRQRLAGVGSAWAADNSIVLCSRIADFIAGREPPFRSLLGFVAAFPAEVDLSELFKTAISNGVVVYLPVMSSGRELDFYSISDWPALLRPGPGGVPEPEPAEDRRFDCAEAGNALVLVPGLAFTRTGHRLGRGGGYYDRFLARKGMSDSTAAGTGWSFQVVETIPAGPLDMNVKWIFTEEGYFEC